MAESKYAARLRELGFVPLSAAENAYIERRFAERTRDAQERIKKLPRTKRRLLKKRLASPSFLVIGDETHATDEIGGRWKAMGMVDLSSLGFEDSSMYAVGAATMEPLDLSKKMH